jgi:dATP pyrophosphohydrolase
MTRIATDIVDVYVFRRLNARVQFLLLQRRNDVPMARTWQAFHHEIAEGQTAPEAASAALSTLAGLTIERFYSADYINQFYDEARDAVVLAPVLAVTVRDQSNVTLADDFQDAGWFDRDEATARLPFSGQRWAVRHIDEIMGIGEAEAELYRFVPSESGPHGPADQPSVRHPDVEPGPETDDIGLEPPAERDVDGETSTAQVSVGSVHDAHDEQPHQASRQD